MIIATQGTEATRTEGVEVMIAKNIEITKKLLKLRGFITPAFLFITDKKFGMQLFDTDLATATKSSPLEQCYSFVKDQLDKNTKDDRLLAYQCVSEAWLKVMSGETNKKTLNGMRYGDIEKMAGRIEMLMCTTVKRNCKPVLQAWDIKRKIEGIETSSVVSLKERDFGSEADSPKTPMFNESGLI